MTQQHGRRYENELANDLSELTTDDVWVGTVGYSGNSARGGCDLVATVSPKLVTRSDAGAFHVEAKKRQGDAGNLVTVMDGSSKGETGLDELWGLVESSPSWAVPILEVKFDHREAYVVDARDVLAAVDELDRPVPDGVDVRDVRVTDSGLVRMRKPTLDEWASATAGREDAVVVAEKLGLPHDGDDE